jgi:hypothetical protein
MPLPFKPGYHQGAAQTYLFLDQVQNGAGLPSNWKRLANGSARHQSSLRDTDSHDTKSLPVVCIALDSRFGDLPASTPCPPGAATMNGPVPLKCSFRMVRAGLSSQLRIQSYNASRVSETRPGLTFVALRYFQAEIDFSRIPDR